ncbi:unnamed protein product, partial [Gulo gulo]
RHSQPAPERQGADERLTLLSHVLLLESVSEDVVCPATQRASGTAAHHPLDRPGPPCQEPQESRLPEWLEAGGWR